MSFTQSFKELEDYLETSKDTAQQKIRLFAKYTTRQTLTEFITRYELFKKTINLQGSIVDCGVNAGQSLFTFAKLSSILEPYNFTRKIYGFDSFAGFPEVSYKEMHSKSKLVKKGGAVYSDIKNIEQAIKIFDLDRAIPHLPKIEIINGDLKETLPVFLESHPELMISLLNVDMDIYEPTKIILEQLVPLVVKGGIIIFDEINNEFYQGESIALKEILGLDHYFHREYFEGRISYMVK